MSPTLFPAAAARRCAAEAIVAATIEMARTGRPLMARVLPEAPELWAHYPADDAVDPITGARWYYHAHPPEQRGGGGGEHGHFHLFLNRHSLRADAVPLAGPRADGAPRADVVHIAALSVDPTGLPVGLFANNRWVTDEWLYPAPAIADALGKFNLDAAPGDPLVNRWLTAAVALFAPEIAALLEARDAVLAGHDGSDPFEDRSLETVVAVPVDLDAAVDAAFA